MDTIAQVIHECETCAAIKQAKRLKPMWYGGRWLKYKYGEAWRIDYITLPQNPKASAMCLPWWKQPPDGRKLILCPMLSPGTLSWALKSKSCGDTAPQRELSHRLTIEVQEAWRAQERRPEDQRRPAARFLCGRFDREVNGTREQDESSSYAYRECHPAVGLTWSSPSTSDRCSVQAVFPLFSIAV
ncbi:hypothetical protein QYF61_027167 [Mycteria americana]|uniref:Integrase zinc-binding domain-containing protein n=1 Tax=Mycteria americana TaxID=33587 RepID=A0AAN7NIC8_MYCAM|nr:hypothetical protein QYF61_027167 [Mycteria americana]